MKVKATPFMIAALMLFTALPAFAQPQQVTVREINAIAQENIDMLNSLGTAVTATDIDNTGQGGNGLIFNALNGVEVQFTAVFLSDPLNSGLSTSTATSPPVISRKAR